MKKWYQSKTLWTNLLATVALVVQTATGHSWFPAEAQAGVIAILNIFLRFTTSSGIDPS